MKKIIFIIASALILLPKEAKAQHDETDRMGIILSTGYKHLPSVKVFPFGESYPYIKKSYNAFKFEITLHNHFNNIDFNGSFHYGKDYMSFEAFSLLGMLYYYFVKYGEGGYLLQDDNNKLVTLFMLASAFSTTSFNISVGEQFKIRPYWSLLRLSRIKNVTDGLKFNVGLGTYLTYEINHRIMISPFCEYAFGYEKKSPFTGVNFGLSVGIKLYDDY
ncbi:MAG: hypothetical protein LBE13_15320 [Bacteroidales bacterium]|nr:hypothetical protein [Bacteroidales bacterium]